MPEGKELAIRPAVLAEAFTEPLKSLPKRLHDAFHVRSTEAGWRDAAPLLWSPALLVHGAKLTHGEHRAILDALGDDIVWNGGPIDGMSDEDAAALEEVHAQRL